MKKYNSQNTVIMMLLMLSSIYTPLLALSGWRLEVIVTNADHAYHGCCLAIDGSTRFIQ